MIDEDGATVSSTDIRSPVGIQIGYRILRTEPMAFAKLKLIDRRGDIAFNALDTRSAARDGFARRPVATAWIPGNLLNDGLTAIDVELVSIAAPKLHHHAQERQALAFHVVDPGAGDSARRSRGSCAA